jgi:hypothetical protein
MVDESHPEGAGGVRYPKRNARRRQMKKMAHLFQKLPVVLLTSVLVLGFAPLSHAQPSVRDIANLEMLQGKNHEMAADSASGDDKRTELALAQSSYEEVWDLDDDDNEFGDIRAEAGIHLGMVLVRRGHPEKGLEWFDRVAQMKGVPDELTSGARKLADKLRDKLKQQN